MSLFPLIRFCPFSPIWYAPCGRKKEGLDRGVGIAEAKARAELSAPAIST